MAAAADVVDLARARGANEFGKGFDQIEAVNVVSDLFSFVPENPVRSAAYGTDHQVREKTMQFGPGVRRAGETTATKRNGRHSEISPVFLDENIRRNFRCAEKRMLRVIDTHRLRDTELVFVAWLYFPAHLEFAQRDQVFFFPDEHLGRNTAIAMGIAPERIVVWDPKRPLGGATEPSPRSSHLRTGAIR